MKVRITQDDIDNGEQKDVNECPIALALKRRNYKNVQVANTVLLIENNEEEMTGCSLPENAIEFIKLFDKGKPVKPLTIEIFPK